MRRLTLALSKFLGVLPVLGGAFIIVFIFVTIVALKAGTIGSSNVLQFVLVGCAVFIVLCALVYLLYLFGVENSGDM